MTTKKDPNQLDGDNFIVDETKVAPVVKDQEVSEELNIDQIVQAAIEKALETAKNEIAGLNRKNSELDKALKLKELEGKTEEEKTELLKQEKQKIEAEIASLNRGRLIDKTLSKAGLSLELSNRILGSTEEEIESDVLKLQTYISDQVKILTEADINKRLAGETPSANTGSVSPNTISREKFETLNDFQKMEMIKKGVKIN